ncbi:hypothetical protein PanWU01x14_065860 [Parasponia andersonii]|uniref:Uncharacterized protein n=1 Tax=Parasponia andersonii TaxID=3476 RepID=A0A2P5DGX7_PARAD|nr:hypothetical protein PanWU01x14_065860 [Parasponia andersonii]
MSWMGEAEKLDTAIIRFDGEALSWFQWEDQLRPIQSRTEASQEGTLSEKFMVPQPTGSVRDYRRKFEIPAAPIGDIPEHALEGHFINGLKADVNAGVRLLAVSWTWPNERKISEKRIRRGLICSQMGIFKNKIFKD